MESLRQIFSSPASLVVFEAAARHGSFTEAGRELGMSQAAVSLAIRKLEADLGAQLFARAHRRVQLTEAGSRFFNDVSVGLGQIKRAAIALRARAQGGHVTISASTAFASYWMLPRLERLRAELPGVDLRMETSDRDTDIMAEAIPLAIRRGNAPFAGCESALLADEIIVPLASPRYIDRAGWPQTPGELARHRLIHLEEPYRPCPAWPDWFRGMGVGTPSRAEGLLINDYALVVQAMMEGQGIGLGWRHLTDGLVEAGVLMVVGPELAVKAGYHLVWPRDIPLSEEAAKVRDWVLAERGPFAAG